MIDVDIITRDEIEGATYFVAELKEGEAYGLFSLYDIDAAEGDAAVLEFIGDSPKQIMDALQKALRERAKNRKNGGAPAEAAADDETASDEKPVRRKRRAAQ